MSNWGSLIPLVLVVIAFWLLVLRPARNRQRDFMATQQSLAPGSRVMLASGVFGELVSIGDDEVRLRIAPDVVIDVARQAVAKVIEPAEAADDQSTDEHPDH